MAKTVLVICLIALWGAGGFQRGCTDATRSLTKLTYFDKRDMRNTVGFVPQKTYLRAPDTLSVPTTGRELWNGSDVVAERARFEKTFTNPQAADDSSIARGERKFM